MPAGIHAAADSITEQLSENGFAIVPEVVTPQTTESLIAEIEARMNHQESGSPYAIRNLIHSIPALRIVAESPAIRSLVEPALGPDAFVARSLFFDKTPEANWKVAWHQDLTIAVRERMEIPGFEAWSVKDGVIHVQPPASILERMLTVRLHLDDCDISNGPLRVIPNSHCSGRLTTAEIADWYTRAKPVTCTVSRGGVVLMRPLLLHASSPALEPRHRRVVHLEFAKDSLPGGLSWV